jgi:hypothetical protein
VDEILPRALAWNDEPQEEAAGRMNDSNALALAAGCANKSRKSKHMGAGVARPL